MPEGNETKNDAPSDAEIEAAARAVFDTDDELDTGAMWDETSAVMREWCRDIATAALVAARRVLASYDTQGSDE